MKQKSKTPVNKIPLFDSKGKKKETLELNKDVFKGHFNKALLYESIKMYRANQRKGNSDTKRRGEVRGGGKKPWRQKGTGRARVASIRNPIWRGGGIAFGPHPRDFRYSLPKKMKKSAFISSINAKLKSGGVVALEEVSLKAPKTKLITSLFKKINIGKKVLFLVDKIDKNLFLATRNIKGLTLKRLNDATALDVLSHSHLVITEKAAVELNKGRTAA